LAIAGVNADRAGIDRPIIDDGNVAIEPGGKDTVGPGAKTARVFDADGTDGAEGLGRNAVSAEAAVEGSGDRGRGDVPTVFDSDGAAGPVCPRSNAVGTGVIAGRGCGDGEIA
jgi:hypothetical protein